MDEEYFDAWKQAQDWWGIKIRTLFDHLYYEQYAHQEFGRLTSYPQDTLNNLFVKDDIDAYTYLYDMPFVVHDDYSDNAEVSEKEFMRVLTA